MNKTWNKILSLLKNKWIIAIILTLIILSPILFLNFDKRGLTDWDYSLFIIGSTTKTINEFGQFPFWNPYYCGGTLFFSTPQNPTFTIVTFLSLIFGDVTGIKLSYILAYIVGIAGMIAFSLHEKKSLQSSILAAIVFMFSMHLILMLKGGYIIFMYAALIPWILLSLEKSISRREYIILGSVLVALHGFMDYSHTFFVMTCILLSFGLFSAIIKKNNLYIRNAFLILFFGLLLTSVKLIPSVETLYDLRLETEGEFLRHEGYDSFKHILMNSAFINHDDYSQVIGKSVDNGLYISLAAVLLALVGIAMSYKEKNTKIFFICLLIVMLLSLEIISGSISENIFPYNHYFGPMQFNIAIAFFFALLAAIGLEFVAKKNNLFAWILVLIILIDLGSINFLIAKDSFPLDLPKAGSDDFKQIFHDYKWTGNYATRVMPDRYAYLLNNEGMTNCVDRVKILPKVESFGYDNYRGEVYTLSGSGVSYIYWSPNKLVISHDSNSSDEIIINQNYYKYWTAKSNNGKLEVLNYYGKIMVKTGPEDKTITLRFVQKSFFVGLLTSILVAVLLWQNFKPEEKTNEKKRKH